MNKRITLLVLILFPVFVLSQNNPKLIGYWHNWNASQAPYIHLDEIDGRYNIICVAFGLPVNYDDMTIKFTPEIVSQSAFITKIRKLQDSGKKVLLSIGGATAVIDLFDSLRKNQFVISVSDLLNTYGFDGIDIDIEHGSSILITGGTITNPTNVSQVNLIDAIKEIMKNYWDTFGKKMFLTMAPETAYVQGGQSGFGSIWGGYLPIIHSLRDSIDILQVQLYNSGTMYGIDGKIYSQGTPDFILAMTEAVIKGFNTNGGYFYGIPETKVAIGLPACSQAAGGGFIDSANIVAAVNYLFTKEQKPGDYVLQSKYENLCGMMTWSINWDGVESCGGKYTYANTWQTLFNPKKLDLPQKVTLVSPNKGIKIKDTTIKLVWNRSQPEVIKYEVNILKNNLVVNKDTSIIDTFYNFRNYELNTYYTWRVRAYNQSGWGEWSDTWNFTSKDPEIKKPEKVTLIHPPDNYRMVSDTVNITWKFLDSNVTHYFITMYENGKLFLNISFSKEENYFNVCLSDYDREYKWQITAYNQGIFGEPSDTWTFYSKMAPPPPPPLPNTVELIHPKMDSILYQDSVKFIWHKSEPLVEFYEFESNINSVSLWTLDSIKDTTITVKNVKPLENYKWRVRAKNVTGWGKWSDWHKFSVCEEPVDIPQKISLLFPVDSSFIKENKITLIWNKGRDSIDRYSLEILANSETYLQDSTITDTMFVLTDLSSSEYKWRVRGYNKSGYGQWSGYFTFFVELKSVFFNKINSTNFVFPNPASNLLFIDLRDINLKEEKDLTLFNSNGQIVMIEQINFISSSFRINIESLPAGTYYVKIGDSIQKIIVNK